MRKLSSKNKAKRAKAQDEDASSTPDTSANFEANENGGKNEESSGNESDNSKTVKRKSRKIANEKIYKEVDEKEDEEEDTAKEEKDDEDANDEEEKEDADAGEPEEPEYEVQDIVDQKVEKGKTYYLIRWKGYGADDDTWEAEETLSCPDIISKFKKKNAKQSAAKSTQKSSKGKQGSRKRKAEESSPDADEEPTDPEKEWEVARIIDVGYDKGVRLFRIRWKGYSSKNDTWEPEEHLNCTDLIEKFLENLKNKDQVEQKELREQPKRTNRLTGDAYRRGSKRNAGKTRAVYYEGDD